MAQQNIREAADYFKGILDNAIADLRAKRDIKSEEVHAAI